VTVHYVYSVPSELASKKISGFPQKMTLTNLSMTGVCGYMEEKESYAITSYLQSLPGGDSRR